MIRHARWILPVLVLGSLLLGCGEDEAESVDSADLVRDLEAKNKNAERLAELRRQLARRQRQQREREAAPDRKPAAPASSGLPGFDALAGQLGGEVGVAVGPVGSSEAVVAGNLTSGSAWSTIKVPIALRVLEDAGGPGGLSGSQRADIESALTASDNAAASRLFDALGARHGGLTGAASAVADVLRSAGDTSTTVSTEGRDGFSPYGQTEWTLEAQQRFMAALAGGCISDRASVGYVLDLMGQVTSDSWGLGSSGAPARWKGGWGPGTDGKYLVRQMGVLDEGGKQVAVAIAARPSDGQFVSGQAMATQIAAWLVSNGLGGGGSTGRC